MEYRLGLYEKALPKDLSWREKFSIAKEAGFDFLEMSIDETDNKLSRLDMSKKECEELHDLMVREDFYLESMCLSGHRSFPFGSMDKKVRERSTEIMRKAIVLARNIGIRVIQLAGYDVYYEASNEMTKKYFEENLRRSVEFAADYGVILAFETMETPFMNTVKKAMKWVEKIDSPYLGVYPDSGNITNAAFAENGDVVEDIKSGAGHIFAVHLKESLPGKFREIPYGTGHVNFSSVIDETYKLGVRKYLAEFWYTGQDSWKSDVSEACRFLRSYFI